LNDENTKLGLSLMLARTKTACANKAADFIAPFIRAHDPLKGDMQRFFTKLIQK